MPDIIPEYDSSQSYKSGQKVRVVDTPPVSRYYVANRDVESGCHPSSDPNSPWDQFFTPVSCVAEYGASYGNDPTASVQFKLSAALQDTFEWLVPSGIVKAISSPWGVQMDPPQLEIGDGKDLYKFCKRSDVKYELVTFGFQLKIYEGKSFGDLDGRGTFNMRHCDFSFQDVTPPSQRTPAVFHDGPAQIIFKYGVIWGINPTSSVGIELKEELKEMTLLFPAATVKTVAGLWGATHTKDTYEGMDRLVFKPMSHSYPILAFGFQFALQGGKTFDGLQIRECQFNGRPGEVTFKDGSTPSDPQTAPKPYDPKDPQKKYDGPLIDPFPKRVLDKRSGLYVKNNLWTPVGSTYKTYQQPSYASGGGNQKYLVGGYFTDWGVYSGYTPARLPLNNINFIQIAFAAICGFGNESNWYDNESASPEAKPKINELCKGKPVGTMIILDHWSHYGKKDMNVPRWQKSYADPAYHVDGYERGLNLFGFGYGDEYPIHNVGGKVLSKEDKLNYAFGIQQDFRSYHQALNGNGRKFNMFLSIGGWTLSDPFPSIAADPVARQTFVSSVTGYLAKNRHINGIDIDWEFIGVDGEKKGIMFPRDTNNYTLLMSELRDGLDALGQGNGTKYHLSAAIGTAPRHLNKINWNPVVINGKQYRGMKSILDHIFLMSYDYYGSWGPTIGHQSPLYTNGETVGYSCDSAVTYLKQAGVPSRKIILGVAAYGRIWQNAVPSRLNDSGKYTFPNHATGSSSPMVGSQDGVVFWHHLKRAAYDANGTLKDEYRWVRDETAKAEFLIYEHTETGTNFVTTVDTPYSVKEKALYVKEQELGGIFSWSLDNDNGDLLNAIHEGLGSTKQSDSLEPSFRENSMLQYRVKEANYYSNDNIKQSYWIDKIKFVFGNFITMGGQGMIESILSCVKLPYVLASSKSVKDLTDEEWEEYLKLIKSIDGQEQNVANLDISTARDSALLSTGTYGFVAIDTLFSIPFMNTLGMALDAGGMEALFDLIPPNGGDYSSRITRGMDPWEQMRKDFSTLSHNYFT